MKPHENLSLKNIKGETWKDVKGYVGYYKASNFGRIKSCKRIVKIISCRGKKHTHNISEKILKLSFSKGYLVFRVSKNGIKKMQKAHRIVASCFLRKLKTKNQVNHKNGIKHDNRIINLEWCTASENVIHSFRAGLKFPCREPSKIKGSMKTQSKLHEKDVRNIRKLYSKGIRIFELTKLYPVSDSAIEFIIRKKTWKHVK